MTHRRPTGRCPMLPVTPPRNPVIGQHDSYKKWQLQKKKKWFFVICYVVCFSGKEGSICFPVHSSFFQNAKKKKKKALWNILVFPLAQDCLFPPRALLILLFHALSKIWFCKKKALFTHKKYCVAEVLSVHNHTPPGIVLYRVVLAHLRNPTYS